MKNTSIKEFIKIVKIHNVSGKSITADQISEETLVIFNTKYNMFMQKHPNFDVFENDYNGQDDDEFVELLIEVLKNDNITLF